MLAIFGNLVLILQAWVMTSVRAQTGGSLQPPYHIVTISGMDDNVVGFECREIATEHKLDNWVLYRNCVPENTTDPCISDENYSDGLLTISSQCDGLYSCGVEYTSISSTPDTMGLVLTEPVPVYAMPTPIETGVQSVSACVGETVFLPSFVPVSPLGNNEVIWFRVQSSGAMTAENGIVTADYSYNLVSVSTLDAGTYFARVTNPDGDLVNGPSVMLTVTEKPEIHLIEVVDGQITVTVVPSDADFEYKWRLNGVNMSEENGQTFSLPPTINEDDKVEVTISSPCGASVTATIYILTTPTESPSLCPVTEQQLQIPLTIGLPIIIVLFVIIILLAILLIVITCVWCSREKKKSEAPSSNQPLEEDERIKKLEEKLKELDPRRIEADTLTRSDHTPAVLFKQKSVQTTEIVVRFKEGDTNSHPSGSVNRIARVFSEVIPLIQHWDHSDTDTLHTVYVLLNSIFNQVNKSSSSCQIRTKQCLLKIRQEVLLLKADIDNSKIQRSCSYPETDPSTVTPEQETREQETRGQSSDEERGIEADSSGSRIVSYGEKRSISAPAEVGEPEQLKLMQLLKFAGEVENVLENLFQEISEKDDSNLTDHIHEETPV